MAQTIGIPRFYCNVIEFLHVIGKIDLGTGSNKIFTLPVIPNFENFPSNPIDTHGTMATGKNFIAILNYKGDTSFNLNGLTLTPVLGNDADSGVCLKTTSNTISQINPVTGKGGSFVIGTYFDMLDAPNLSLSMSREYGNIKETTSYNGSSFSNTMSSNSPAPWGKLGAWEIDENNSIDDTLGRSGRRVWELEFSYLYDRSLFGVNQMISHVNISTSEAGYINDDIYDETQDSILTPGRFKYNLISSTDFFSEFWWKTLGGSIPFIFQSDNTNNSPDNFSIARVRENSISFKQSAYNIYDISMTIEETW